MLKENWDVSSLVHIRWKVAYVTRLAVLSLRLAAAKPWLFTTYAPSTGTPSIILPIRGSTVAVVTAHRKGLEPYNTVWLTSLYHFAFYAMLPLISSWGLLPSCHGSFPASSCVHSVHETHLPGIPPGSICF